MPLILTLQIDERAQAFYDGLRRRYFPPERNFLSAHVSLFHQLPDEERVYEDLGKVAAAMRVFRLTDCRLSSTGRGVAVFFESGELSALHRRLSDLFRDDLIPQDRQGFRPHIVIQNKVEADTARRTLAELDAGSMVEPSGMGVTVWRYLGGPWERLREFPFDG